MNRTTLRNLGCAAAILFILMLFATGCASAGDKQGTEEMHGHEGHGEIMESYETTASADVPPSFLGDFTETTKKLYAQAAPHAELLKQLNCYCGCMDYNDPHDSLYRCFIVNEDADGAEWTDHGAKCGVCLMELRDVAKLAEEGKSADEIRSHIDSTYGGKQA
jgi:hypothetical protein